MLRRIRCLIKAFEITTTLSLIVGVCWGWLIIKGKSINFEKCRSMAVLTCATFEIIFVNVSQRCIAFFSLDEFSLSALQTKVI